MSATVRDTAGVTARIATTNLQLPPRRQQVGVTTTVHPGWREIVRDTLQVRDAAAHRSLVRVTATGGVTDTVTPRADIRIAVRDRLGVQDRAAGLEATVTGVEEKLGASGRVAAAGVAVQVRDGAGVTAQVLTQMHGQEVLRDKAGVRDAVRPGSMLWVQDTVAVQGRAVLGARPARYVRDRAGITTHVTIAGGPRAWVRDKAAVTGYARPSARTRIDLHDRAFLHDRVHVQRTRMSFDGRTRIDHEVPLHATDAWSADMRSWGMSRYAGLPVFDFAGTQYGVGPGGVFTTQDDAVFSYMETGATDLAQPDEPMPQRKRLNYVYTYSAHAKPLRLVITADHNGRRQQVVYTQDNRSSDHTRAVRCAVGRGFATNYVQLRIGGPAFDMARFEVEITPTQRRI